jgi:HAD superfamily hydrolase (TIGR01509 family)
VASGGADHGRTARLGVAPWAGQDGRVSHDPTPRLAAVFFDMDGTLVDTEKLWDVALRELATRYGGVLSDEARAAMIGSSSDHTMRVLSADLKLPDLDVDEGADWLVTRTGELFAEGIPWRPGAADLLAAVRAAGIPSALVTNTARSLVDVALLTLGAANFDAVICGDEVAFTKPHPEHYLAAARALGVDPARCVAIEDSPTGLASARAAGCALLAIPNEIPLTGTDIAGATVRASLLEVDLPLLYRLVTS